LRSSGHDREREKNQNNLCPSITELHQLYFSRHINTFPLRIASISHPPSYIRGMRGRRFPSPTGPPESSSDFEATLHKRHKEEDGTDRTSGTLAALRGKWQPLGRGIRPRESGFSFLLVVAGTPAAAHDLIWCKEIGFEGGNTQQTEIYSNSPVNSGLEGDYFTE
jgi:hypothetical protein